MIVNLNQIDLAKINDPLVQAIIIAIFTDAYAEDDELPATISENGGWWGDDLEVDLNNKKEKISWGSKLWLRRGQKINEQTPRDIEFDLRDCLRPLIKGNFIQEPLITVATYGNAIQIKIVYSDTTEPLILESL